MPIHTTTSPIARAFDVAERAQEEVWKRTGDAQLSEQIGARVFKEAFHLFSETPVGKRGWVRTPMG